MNHAEAVAKLVRESVIPGTMIYQRDQSHGECDFELRYRGWQFRDNTLPFPLYGQV
jgi:hypothetical protein